MPHSDYTAAEFAVIQAKSQIENEQQKDKQELSGRIERIEIALSEFARELENIKEFIGYRDFMGKE